MQDAARLRSEHASDFHALLAAIENSEHAETALAVQALAQVRDGVITGEGPTVAGRIHFSRTIDAQDASLCRRILMAAGGEAGSPVTRHEAEILLAVDAAAGERHDGGSFEDLLVKAIAHHMLGAAGRAVPPRPIALAADIQLSTWATPAEIKAVDAEIANWLGTQMSRQRRVSMALATLTGLMVGASTAPVAQSLAALVDLGA